MVFYDFEKMWIVSGGNSDLMLLYFKALVRGDSFALPLKGENFIVNEKIVTQNPEKFSNRELAEYLGLCALRNYSNYRIHGITSLELEYVPNWIPANVVRSNPLINLNKSTIYFINEEKT